MINVKAAVERARRDQPLFMLLGCEQLDNGVIFFGRSVNQKPGERVFGAVGLFVPSDMSESYFVPLGFYAEHIDEGTELDISRFQTPQEREEAVS